MRFVIYLLILIPSLLTARNEFSINPITYIPLCDKVTSAHAREVCKRFKMEGGANGGSFMNDVKSLSFSFEKQGCFTISQARDLYIRCFDLCLAQINADKPLRPYLHHYPFDRRDVEYHIAFQSRSNAPATRPFVSLVMYANEKLYYDTFNPATGSYEELYREPIEEAMAIWLKGG